VEEMAPSATWLEVLKGRPALYDEDQNLSGKVCLFFCDFVPLSTNRSGRQSISPPHCTFQNASPRSLCLALTCFATR
jgi:hypothetical protein